MAKKYHINPRTGGVSACGAKIKCPFGDLTKEHYPTRQEAQATYEKRMEEDNPAYQTALTRRQPRDVTPLEEDWQEEVMQEDISLPPLPDTYNAALERDMDEAALSKGAPENMALIDKYSYMRLEEYGPPTFQDRFNSYRDYLTGKAPRTAYARENENEEEGYTAAILEDRRANTALAFDTNALAIRILGGVGATASFIVGQPTVGAAVIAGAVAAFSGVTAFLGRRAPKAKNTKVVFETTTSFNSGLRELLQEAMKSGQAEAYLEEYKKRQELAQAESSDNHDRITSVWARRTTTLLRKEPTLPAHLVPMDKEEFQELEAHVEERYRKKEALREAEQGEIKRLEWEERQRRLKAQDLEDKSRLEGAKSYFS